MKRAIIAILLSAVLLTACAACGGNPAPAPEETGAGPAPVLVTLLVTMPDGTQNTHQVPTEKRTLGEALRDMGLIECDETGYITAVEGVEANWDRDQAYWSFEIDGKYATHGVNDEVIEPGRTYELKYTKG